MSELGRVIDDVLAAVAERAGKSRTRLDCQRQNCRVLEHTETPGGFFTVLEVNRAVCEATAGKGRRIIPGVFGQSAQYPLGADFLVFLEDGYLTLIECCRIGPPWGPIPRDTVFEFMFDADIEESIQNQLD